MRIVIIVTTITVLSRCLRLSPFSKNGEGKGGAGSDDSRTKDSIGSCKWCVPPPKSGSEHSFQPDLRVTFLGRGEEASPQICVKLLVAVASRSQCCSPKHLIHLPPLFLPLWVCHH